ncbi:MAG: tetratricopeptide repeat protein [Bryobacteraceae bacterium]|nr:tetratricopeptide repeat protein [Bryobacteraceae bacterium]
MTFFLLLLALQSPADWLAQAQKHFQQQQWSASREAARKALAIDPKLGDAHVLLGLVATVESKFAEAEAEFLQAVALQPANPRAHAYLGSTYLQRKKWDDAARSFEQVLKLDAGNLSAHYNLGLIALTRNQPAEALARFERVYRAAPNDVEALIGMLESQLLLKRAAEARQTAAMLGTLVDSRDPRLFQAATMLGLYGEYAAAIPLLERVRKAHPESYDAAYNLALAQYQASEYDRAAEELQALRTAEAYNLLGAVEEKRKRMGESFEALKKAAELDSRNEDFRYDHATAILLYREVKDAVASFEAAARDFPRSWRLRLGLGAAQYLAGNYDAAVQALLDAARIEPEARPVFRLLGLTYETAPAMQPEIAKAFAGYLKRRDDDAWAHYHYGAILSMRARAGEEVAQEAKTRLRRALELEPDLAVAHMEMGVLAQATGDVATAVQSLERAVKLRPDLATAHYRLGLAYQKIGEKEKSRAELALFQKLKAASEESERILVRESVVSSEPRR